MMKRLPAANILLLEHRNAVSMDRIRGFRDTKKNQPSQDYFQRDAWTDRRRMPHKKCL